MTIFIVGASHIVGGTHEVGLCVYLFIADPSIIYFSSYSGAHCLLHSQVLLLGWPG